jgi:release factor glutamine methyltransferase
MADNDFVYETSLTTEDVERIRCWHERAYREGTRDADQTFQCLGYDFVVPPDVHPIVGMSDMLGQAVLDDVSESDRVLDMGTGCGINAVLAASKSRDVLAVDVNPSAVRSARTNARRHGVADRITVQESDVFSSAPGVFDLIIFDPPFRWFRPRDLRERASTDEDYRTLRTFFAQAKDHLSDNGRMLMFFGSSGDIAYFQRLSDQAGFRRQTLRTREFERDGHTVTYYVFRLTGARDADVR